MDSKGTCFAGGEDRICLSLFGIECAESLSLDFLMENGTKERCWGGLEIGKLGKNEVGVCFGWGDLFSFLALRGVSCQ